MQKSKKHKAVDLYSGIGGWTLGMKMSGVENLASFEWWTDANRTHNMNFGTDHEEVDIRSLEKSKLPNPQDVDLVVGSPPCTQFSFANKGGNGDLDDGLLDIKRFLEVVKHLAPKYWAMENVPRVSKILEKELLPGGKLEQYSKLFTVNMVVNSADYGVPQNRKRMIAGNFPEKLFCSYAKKMPRKTLNDVLNGLCSNPPKDAVYGHGIKHELLTDNSYEAFLSPEEERMNREAKTFHPVYNKMSFPEDLGRPARTITATCTRVSRESLVIEDPKEKGKFRRLSVRERGIAQSFPISYQFYGNSISSKNKMIGNAIPPLLAYYIIQSMLERPLDELLHSQEIPYRHPMPRELPKQVSTDLPGKAYPKKRRFRYAVPHLRFGSGMRFELSNTFPNGLPKWSIKFFFGNSKDIKTVDLDQHTLRKSLSLLNAKSINAICKATLEFHSKAHQIKDKDLQDAWTRRGDRCSHPFALIDELGLLYEKIEEGIDMTYGISMARDWIQQLLKSCSNAKINKFYKEIFVGVLMASYTNTHILIGDLD